MSNIIIYGGGTFSPIRNHMSLCAMSFGQTATWLKNHLPQATLRLTKMSDRDSKLVTNEDVKNDLDKYLADYNTSVIIMSSALCDYDGQVGDVVSGSHATRLKTREDESPVVKLTPADKLILYIKQRRPDICIVGFKTTTNETQETQVEYAKRMGVDVVLANDTVTRNNILVYSHNFVSGSREFLLRELVSDLNSHLVKYRSLKEIWVQLDTGHYISKEDAHTSACGLVGLDVGKWEFKQWHSKVEGLAIMRRK